MDSDLQHQQFHHHFQGLQRQMNTGGGLTRFRSAPTSYFSALMDTAPPGGAGAVNLPPPRPLSPDTDSFLAQFVQSVTDAGEGGLGTDDAPVQPVFAVTVKQETDQNLPSLSVNNSSNQMSNYLSSSKPPLARRSSNSFTASSRCGMESELRVPSVNFLPSQVKTETGTNDSSLSRFNSSPAAVFDDLIIENGYLVNKTSGPETYGSNNKSINDEMNTDGSFIGSFPAGSWDEDSSVFSDQFPKPESGVGELDPSENENQVRGEGEKRPWEMLAHHLSLPKASLEKLMQLQQDSVPCQMRAKRGCATHPRSIAERVRRTKISERMRKLQDLVPNMDKQTNTSDMLDFAADYIKDLQRQLQTLSNKRARCTCS